MRLHPTLLAVALAAGFMVPAKAQMTVYYHVGAWDAFDGPGDNGQPLCGIGSRNPADGRAFSLRFQIGGDDMTFTAAKPSWNIPDGTHIQVVVQNGLEQPWTQQAIGKGDRMQWTLDRVNAQIFDDQFRRAPSMTITFPSGNEPPWTLSLAGSTAASNAMGRCLTDLAQRAPATQPAPTPAPPAATQPFGAAAAAPDNAAPAPPGTQGQPTQPNAAPTAPATQDQPTQPNATPASPVTQDQPTQPNAAPAPAH